MANNGHECVMVNCSSWTLDPIIHPFQPTLDRHVGQRNLHVIAAPPGSKITYRLHFTNAFPMDVTAIVAVQFDRWRPTHLVQTVPARERSALAATYSPSVGVTAADATNLLRRNTHAHRTAQHVLALARRGRGDNRALYEPLDDIHGAAGVAAAIGDTAGVIDLAGSRFGGDLLASLRDFRSKSAPFGTPITEVSMDAATWRPIEVEISVPSSARPDDLVITHIAQQVGPLTLGGYTIVVQVSH
jgi:hypothetical protein